MAAERSRRHNAGNKMSRLLEAEDEDDFYKTTYGGFTEVYYFWCRNNEFRACFMILTI